MRYTIFFSALFSTWMTFGQAGSGLEFSYDFVPVSIAHYDISNPGSFENKYRQPYNYLGTLKRTETFKNSTFGIVIRGFWLNGNEKTTGAQLDYYYTTKQNKPLRVCLGLSTLWTVYRFKANALDIRIQQHFLQVIPNIKLVHSIQNTAWDLKATAGIGVGCSSSEFNLKLYNQHEETNFHKQSLMSNPHFIAGVGIGLVRNFKK